jgi:hypothetical protein
MGVKEITAAISTLSQVGPIPGIFAREGMKQ